jgi:cellulose synthase/poly-beta-1,6-N-acetylglucosamine synthase-like glycosyltransferase
MGKPTGLNRMRERATGEVIVITDARQAIDRGALRALLRLLSAPQVGCVTGNLVLAGARAAGCIGATKTGSANRNLGSAA